MHQEYSFTTLGDIIIWNNVTDRRDLRLKQMVNCHKHPDFSREILEQIADAVIFADVEGVIRFWNAAAAELFGFTALEAMGQSLDLIIPERLRAAHWAGFNRAMTSGTTRLGGRATVTRALHKGGQRLYVEMSFAVVRGPDAAVVGSVAMARDVTRRYEAEKLSSKGKEAGSSPN